MNDITLIPVLDSEDTPREDGAVRFVEDPAQRAAIAQAILAALPDWFGIPESTQRYVDECRAQPFFAAVAEDATEANAENALGFAALKRTGPLAAEIAVMGVLPSHHRRGIGSSLLRALKAYAKAQGYAFLQVKTVQMGCYDAYDRTNRFYQRMGFTELECFPTLWDEHNPCQVYVMALGR
ncbi:MAG: GNAT family N-acetyltransferase [Clostridia bacterium]|nr:GNAT family N-acetyltransferase [Clostridia bacterium]